MIAVCSENQRKHINRTFYRNNAGLLKGRDFAHIFFFKFAWGGGIKVHSTLRPSVSAPGDYDNADID
jgi:hypothetical protein